MPRPASLYSLIIAQHTPSPPSPRPPDDADYRTGQLTIEWIDFHGEKEITGSDGTGGGSEGPAAKPSPRNGLEGDEYFEQPAQLVPTRRKTRGTTSLGPGIIHLFRHAPPLTVLESLEAGDLSTTAVAAPTIGNGQSVDDPSRGGGEAGVGATPDGEDGTLVAVLAVPEWMGFDAFGEWLGAWSTRLEGLRMMSDASPNRTMVLLKFEQVKAAEDFVSIYTGKAFSSCPDRAETCHPVQIYHLLLHDTTSPLAPALTSSNTGGNSAAQRPVPQLAQLLKGIPARSVYELPTCPVCLERMDSVVTGLITTPCTHIFNCSCLSKWGNRDAASAGWCPVCRLCHQRLLAPSTTATTPTPHAVSSIRRRPSHNHLPSSSASRDRSSSSTVIQEATEEPRCMQCTEMDSRDDSRQPRLVAAAATVTPNGSNGSEKTTSRSNWICVICGYLGCSRYQRGHARDHYARTGHAYSMEIDTQRVWDYVEDSYVHRLIQNRSDGKLVELPSAASFVSSRISNNLSALSLVDKHLVAGFGPSVSDEKKISKLEDMTLEYSYLLSTQLEQQKQHYEAEIGALKREVKEVRNKVGESDSWRKRFVVEEEKRKAVEERKVPELERVKIMSDKKAQIATDLAKSLQADLRAERALSSGLMEKIQSLETQLAAALAQVEERTGQLHEAEEMVRDLMVSISATEKLAGSEAEGAGGTLVVRPGKGGKRR